MRSQSARAEPWSHRATDEGAAGVLALHGFTGNPSSMRGFAQAMAGGGLHVELPRLPGHGTTVDEMLSTGWADWTAEVDAAYRRLAERAGRIVVAGLAWAARSPCGPRSPTPTSPASCA